MAEFRASRETFLTAGIAILIVYGSLFPFQFHAAHASPADLLRTSAEPAGRDDFLSNILLYFPFGFFVARAFRSRAAAVAVGLLAGGALSFGIEWAQFFDAGRVPSMADVYANMLGALAGSLAAVLAADRFTPEMFLVSCWLGSRTLPYLPSVDLHKYRAAFDPGIPTVAATWHYFGLWLAVAAIISSARMTMWLAAAIFCARIFVVDLRLDASEIVGAMLAILVCAALAERPWREPAIAIFFALFLAEQALEPFRWLTAPRRFGWIPFYSFMAGSRETGSRVFLEKSFMYGALVWLAMRARIPFPAATATGLIFLLRVAQIYLPGRTAEITDALMVLMMAAFLRFTSDRDVSRA